MFKKTPVNPRDLPPKYTPAVVALPGENGDKDKRLVANTRVLENGWLYTLEFDGRRIQYPPTGVLSIEHLPVDSVVGGKNDHGDTAQWYYLDDEIGNETARDIYRMAVSTPRDE